MFKFKTGLQKGLLSALRLSGPLVRDKMYRARKNSIDKKRVVVYLMVARDLFNYSQLWEPIDFK
jgi:hypothetical protein